MLYMEDALEGISGPLDYRYVKIVRFALRSICYWPNELFGAKTWKISKYRGLTTLSVNIFTLVSNTAYLMDKQSSLGMLEIGHMLLTVFLTALTVSRSSVLPMNPKFKNITVKFIDSMHLFHHAHKSEYSKKMILGLTLFNVIPIYLNYSKGKLGQRYLENSTYELAVFMYHPRDATTNRNSYIIVAVFDWYASYLCAHAVCMADLLLFLMIFHIYGHFKILLNLMATFPRPAATTNRITNTKQESLMFSEAELKDVFVKLKECIDYHNYLLE
ncbi:unnamed protein product [Chrysodeixis includens]|uniref:Uncharacterized protein n=1 Tax=Chrysodeixis includens TaxID=689277 RepID=A0A9N8KRG7_CHRIL|nr:unnamed protein product [Chrysodeixis includens]